MLCDFRHKVLLIEEWFGRTGSADETICAVVWVQSLSRQRTALVMSSAADVSLTSQSWRREQELLWIWQLWPSCGLCQTFSTHREDDTWQQY